MNYFELPLAPNTIGSDPVTNLFIAINAAFPQHGLIQSQCKILKIQPAATDTYPNLTYLRIQMGPDEQNIFEYFYNRYNINDYLKNPIFTEAEALQASKLPNSVKLVAAISAKTNQNFRAADFWTSINSLDFSGGRVTPNWYMQAIYDSVYWCGDMYVWLHT